MSRRFVIGFSPATQAEERKISAAIDKMGGSWWHWIPNMWLVDFDDTANVSAEGIFDALTKIKVTAKKIVIEIVDKDWIVTDIKNTTGASMYDWMAEKWEN